MQNQPIYKTAADLGIEEWERDGLIALIGPLSRGELAFDMATSRHDCDTTCCIGGWVDRNHGAKYWCEEGSSIKRALDGGALHALYYESPGFAEDRHAARAIVNFLTLGEPRWDDVMATA